jgi:predicted dehydrogenase
MLKIAIVGTGIIASEHIKGISALPHCELVALCDLNEERVKALAEELNVPYFLDYKEIPEKVDCDAVILNLPHGLHVSATVFFLDKGKHVLVEKPMANTVEECDAMIEASVRSGKKLAIAHVQRYLQGNCEVKKIIDSGTLGRLCMYTEHRSDDYFRASRPAWFTNKKMAGGGVVMNYGAHAFDRIFYTTGARPVSVIANCDNFANERDVEGHAQILAKFDNGMTASITFSAYSDVVYETYYYFTEGALKLTGTSQIQIKRKGEKTWEAVTYNGGEHAFVREIDDFHKYIKGEPTEIPDGEYSRAIIAAIEDVYR